MILVSSTLATLGAILWAGLKMPLGVKGEWEAEYALNPQWLRAWWPLILLGAILWLIWWGVKRCENWRRRSERIFLCFFFVVVFLFYLGTAVLGEFGAAEIPAAVMWYRAMGDYFDEAREIGSLGNLPAYLRNFPERTLRWTSRVSTHPPATTVLFLTFQRAFARSPSLTKGAEDLAAVLPKGEAIFAGVEDKAKRAESASGFILGLLLILLASASAIPAYLLAKEILSPKAAVLALGFSATIPSMHLFSPGIDQTFPLYGLLLSLFILRALRRKSRGYAFIFGLTFYVALSFTLAFLALLIFFFIAVVFLSLKNVGRGTWDVRRATWDAGRLFIFALLGFFASVLILWIALGYNSLAGFYAPFRADRLFYAKWVARSYWKWLGMNPVMFVLFLGVPAAVLWLSGAFKDIVGFISSLVRRSGRSDQRILALTFFLVMILLIVSGRNLGEVERLWAFLMPLAILAGLCHWPLRTLRNPSGSEGQDSERARQPGSQTAREPESFSRRAGSSPTQPTEVRPGQVGLRDEPDYGGKRTAIGGRLTIGGFGTGTWLYLIFLQGLQVISFRLLLDVWATAQYYRDLMSL